MVIECFRIIFFSPFFTLLGSKCIMKMHLIVEKYHPLAINCFKAILLFSHNIILKIKFAINEISMLYGNFSKEYLKLKKTLHIEHVQIVTFAADSSTTFGSHYIVPLIG